MKVHKIFLILMLLLPAGLYAQNLRDTATYSPIILEERGDSLYLEMEISINEHSLNPYQSVTITPELMADDGYNSTKFPTVMINGKKRSRLYKRKQVFNDPYVMNNNPMMRVDIKRSTDTTLVYQYTTTYNSWMDMASLQLNQEFIGCADKLQFNTLNNLANVNVEEYIPYIPSLYVAYVEPIQEPKNRDVYKSAYLDFQIGKSVIIPTFRRNPVELEKIAQTINEIKGNEDVTITGMRIQGFASPDGSNALNQKLSEARANALKVYIRDQFGFSDRAFTVSSGGEDWKGFKKMIEDSDIPDKQQILSIINNHEDVDKKEQQLKALKTSWPILLNDYFPALRRVDYRVHYIIRDYSLEETETLLSKKPDQLSTFELFRLAETYPKDSEEWQKVMAMAVSLYPTDPVANINAAAMYIVTADYESAKIHLDRVQEDPRAFNNMGVYYLAIGDPYEAEKYLKQADESQQESASRNLIEAEQMKENLERWERKQNR